MIYTVEVLDSKDIILYKELIDNCFGNSNPIKKYQEYVQKNDYKIWVIKEDDRIIGSVTQYLIDLFTFNFQPCLMLFNVAVHEDYRNKGVGKYLLNFVINKARKKGYKSISLTCLDSAYPAHKLYESIGFKRSNSFKYSMDL